MNARNILTVLVALGLLVCAPGSAGGGYVAEVLSDNPVGYWRLGEAAGPTATDASGFGRDLNYAAFTAGAFGQAGAIVGDADTAVQFIPNASSPHPTIASANTTDFGFASGQSFSVEYWIKAAPGNASSNDTGVLVKGYDASQSRPWYLSRYIPQNGKVDLYLRNGAGTSKVATSASSITDDQWHHVVGVYDGADAQARLYVDGILGGSATGVPADAYGTNSRPFTLGNHLNRALDARIDEVAVYPAALDNTDAGNRVLAHYLAGSGVTLKPWLNVDFGSAANGSGGPLQDGFVPLEATEGGGNPDVTRTYLCTVGQASTVDVTIGGYTHFRDYAAVTGPFAGLSPLLSDKVLRNADGTMSLTLTDLIPGKYEITTYHHGTQFGGGTFDLVLHDATGDTALFTNVVCSAGTNPSSITTLDFEFLCDGSPVTIDFIGGADVQHLSLNGFALQIVPEPATLALAALGLAGLGGYVRMSRAKSRGRRRA